MASLIETVVVPLDGSSLAEIALAPAQVLAADTGAEILLITATWHTEEADAEADPRLPRGGPQVGREYLGEVSARLAGSTEAPVMTEVAHGFPERPIIEAVQRTPGRVLCMTTRGHSGWGAALLGGLCENIIRQVSCPSLLVGSEYRAGVTSLRGGSVVCAFDGSGPSRAIVAPMQEWALALDLTVRLTMVLHKEGTQVGDAPAGPARVAADEVLSQLRGAGVTAELDVLHGAHPSAGLTRHAVETGAVLMATSTHGAGRKFLQSALGSTALKLTHHAPCPVLVQRPVPA